jgi:hypothetical protein
MEIAKPVKASQSKAYRRIIPPAQTDKLLVNMIIPIAIMRLTIPRLPLTLDLFLTSTGISAPPSDASLPPLYAAECLSRSFLTRFCPSLVTPGVLSRE